MIINDESQQSKKFEFMVPQTQFIDDVWTFSLCNDRYVVFLVQKTVVVPQLLFIFGRRHSFRAAEADPHGPVCSAGHGDSAVAACFGGRYPCCASHAGSQVLPWRRPWRSHSCSSLRNQTLSTALRIWQSVRRSLLIYKFMDSSGRYFWMFPVSSAICFNTGHTLRQFTETFTVHTAENCGNFAVAVLQGRRHFLHGAESDVHGLAIQQTR